MATGRSVREGWSQTSCLYDSTHANHSSRATPSDYIVFRLHTCHSSAQNCPCLFRSPLDEIVLSQTHHDALASNSPVHESHLG